MLFKSLLNRIYNIPLVIILFLITTPSFAQDTKDKKKTTKKVITSKKPVDNNKIPPIKTPVTPTTVKNQVYFGIPPTRDASKVGKNQVKEDPKSQKIVKPVVKKIPIKIKPKKIETAPKPEKIVKTIYLKPKTGLFNLKPGWNLTLSGFLQLNTIYSTESTFNIESPGWVLSNSKGSSLAFTPRFSRIKMNISSPEILSWKTSGVFEMDFYGNLPNSSTSVRQAQPRMRLAYGQLKKGGITIRFGNDWMVAAPQFSSSLESFNLWGQGNLWMRYPQIKATYEKEFIRNYKFSIAGSVGENMSGDSPANTIIRSGGMGNFSSLPVTQARIGFDFKLPGSGWSTIGLSGSWQRFNLESGDFSSQEIENIGSSLDSWFGAIDGKILYKIHGIKVKATFEYHQGTAIGMYWGGILQTIQYRTAQPVGDAPGVKTEALGVKSIGYFADLNILFPCGFGVYGGYGKNVVDEDDLVTSGSRIRNSFSYGGVTFQKDAVMFGLGTAYMRTWFLADFGVKDSILAMFLARFKF
jgi:hypothetical protein